MDNSTGTVRKNDQETNFIGMDLHLDNVVVVVAQNEIKDNTVRSKTVLSKKFKTVGHPNIDELFKVLETYCQDKPHMAVVESTYNWYWLADEFEKRNWNLRLADPSTVSKAGFKYSDDYTDASYLAECVRNGSIRSTAIMPKDDRAVRDLARYRMTLVEDRGRLKTILVNMTANHLSIKLNADKLLKEIDEAVEKAASASDEGATDEVLSHYYDNRQVRTKMRSLLRRIRFLTHEVEALDEELTELIKPNVYATSLQSIKGCGYVTSMLIGLEIGDIGRFRTHKDFVSYCRLAPTSKLSNGKSKGLGNAKNGNAYLSWALTELATFVVRYNPEAKRVYDRYFNRSRLRVKAIRSVAAKIARGIFMMLKNGEVFDMKRCFGG